ncbi:ABC transporter ATP-binding protein [Scopulibacillus cellulosilyticus]|uniref:ABC transporter ATP-binding protein n=1 Tax=Scopulibacillus cellulosilyticus TaxID=2665665 RepID=A0ABW2PVP1_9BACL
MIKLENVSKRYLTNTALKDINLEIKTGHIIGLVGSNGSGKSTTLKLMSGLIRPSKGNIFINNKKADRRICTEVAYLSELDVYYSFYTCEETIKFYASQFNDFNVEKAFDILSFMKLDPKQKVKNLSKGNRGRLKIVLTLAREVPYILMDEPLSGLDPMVRHSIVKGLISFIDLETQTLLITTHEIAEIEQLLDTVIVIKDGQILDVQSVEDIRYKQNLSIVEWMTKLYE